MKKTPIAILSTLLIFTLLTIAAPISPFSPTPHASAQQGPSSPYLVQSSNTTLSPSLFVFNSTGLYWGSGPDAMKLKLPTVAVATASGSCAIASSSSLSHNSTTYTYSFSGAVACSGLSISESYKLYVGNITNSANKKITISGSISKAGTGNVSNVMNLPLILPSSYSVGSNYVNSSDNQASFSWADMQSFGPTWNSSLNALVVKTPSSSASAITFTYDPTLVQHTNTAGTSLAFGSNVAAGDVLIVATATDQSVTGISDTQGNTYTSLVSSTTNGYTQIWSTTAKSSSSDTVSITTASTLRYMYIFEVSGIFPTATTSTGSGTNSPVSVSSFTPTSSAFVLGIAFEGSGGAPAWVAGSGYTLATASINFQGMAEYQVPYGSGATTVSMTFTGSSTWGEVAASFAAGVTQPITLTTANSGPSGTFTLSGCSVSPTTIASDGAQHSYSAAPSCTITITAPSDSSSTRYRFSGISTTTTLTTCASGTCSNSAQTVYYQYNITAKYSVLDSSSPTAPKIEGTQAGAANQLATLTTSYASYWFDKASNVGWTNPLSGSSSTAQYVTPTGNLSSIGAAQTLPLVYYHQYFVNITSCSSCTLTVMQNGTQTIASKSLWMDGINQESGSGSAQIAGTNTFNFTSVSFAAWDYQASGFQVFSNTSKLTSLSFNSATGNLSFTTSAKAHLKTGTASSYTFQSAKNNGTDISPVVQIGQIEDFSVSGASQNNIAVLYSSQNIGPTPTPSQQGGGCSSCGLTTTTTNTIITNSQTPFVTTPTSSNTVLSGFAVFLIIVIAGVFLAFGRKKGKRSRFEPDIPKIDGSHFEPKRRKVSKR